MARGGRRAGAGRPRKLTKRDQLRARIVHDVIVPHLDRARASAPKTTRDRRAVIRAAVVHAARDLADFETTLAVDAHDVDLVVAMVFGRGVGRTVRGEGVRRAAGVLTSMALGMRDDWYRREVEHGHAFLSCRCKACATERQHLAELLGRASE